ncbi:hypothetical protein MAC_06099 [Metarhizium acridum CQMa 102]|uniref:DUF6594 domain-containing protein n=1 Tax=Metarhizium acridum (strain CQMa 102) TaxID=655827 RepID=E9E8A1_METAQ|nr:uncharacterized protein MAC_06099 [Metarhizium acridum CQMa 102]EFY87851.1 hypothetical protein MAC_06099 [Metarhizium acridum CQMa 102]
MAAQFDQEAIFNGELILGVRLRIVLNEGQGHQALSKPPSPWKIIATVTLNSYASSQVRDELVERNHRMLSYDSPQPMNIASLPNWIESRGSLAAEEVAYQDSGNDLLCVAAHADSFLERLELLVEKLAIWSSEYIGKRAKSNVSRSPDVYIFSGTTVKRLAQALAAWGVVLLLLLLVIILSVLQSISLRLVLVVLAAAMAIMLFAMMSHTRTRDLFLAGATYSAVLVVFVAGTGLTTQ